MLTIVIWDVQHGNATYIKTPNGKNIVIDLGVGSYGENDREFSPLMNLAGKWGVTKIDGVVITHPHADHLGDIHNLDRFEPYALERPIQLSRDEIRAGNRVEDRGLIEKYLSVHKSSVSPVPDYNNPFLPENNGGVGFVSREPVECAASNLNNRSIATVIEYAGLKVLVPGDNEPASWSELLTDPTFISAISNLDVLVAPHHGRESGYSAELFELINPRLTVISDGRFCDTSATNRYCAKTKGWKVKSRSRGQESRQCVTTRCDGPILIKIGRNPNGINFLDVGIN